MIKQALWHFILTIINCLRLTHISLVSFLWDIGKSADPDQTPYKTALKYSDSQAESRASLEIFSQHGKCCRCVVGRNYGEYCIWHHLCKGILLTIILPWIFFVKTASAYNICCIYPNAPQSTFTTEANTMNTVQTAKGAVWSGCIFAYYRLPKYINRWQSRWYLSRIAKKIVKKLTSKSNYVAVCVKKWIRFWKVHGIMNTSDLLQS